MRTIGTSPSTCANARNKTPGDASGRKTNTTQTIVAHKSEAETSKEELDSPVIVNHGDAILEYEEIDSVPSLEFDSSDDEDEDEESLSSDDESLEGDDEDVELDEGVAERFRILADCRTLKNLATAFLHPEKPVESSPLASGRNYFSRYSAPEVEDDEDADERAEILAEAAALKKSAAGYMHPEVGVTTTDSTLFGRNYFSRFSAPEVEDDEDADERAEILAEAAALKKSAAGYMHPEVGVTTTDSTLFGRNYFSRFSAPSSALTAVNKPEQDNSSEDMALISKLSKAIKGADLPSTKTSKLGSFDDRATTAKSASSVDLFGLSEIV